MATTKGFSGCSRRHLLLTKRQNSFNQKSQHCIVRRAAMKLNRKSKLKRTIARRTDWTLTKYRMRIVVRKYNQDTRCGVGFWIMNKSQQRAYVLASGWTSRVDSRMNWNQAYVKKAKAKIHCGEGKSSSFPSSWMYYPYWGWGVKS